MSLATQRKLMLKNFQSKITGASFVEQIVDWRNSNAFTEQVFDDV